MVGVEDTEATKGVGVVGGEDGVGDVNQRLKNKSYTIIRSSDNNENNNNNSNEINNNSSYNNRNKHPKSVIQLQFLTLLKMQLYKNVFKQQQQPKIV